MSISFTTIRRGFSLKALSCQPRPSATICVQGGHHTGLVFSSKGWIKHDEERWKSESVAQCDRRFFKMFPSNSIKFIGLFVSAADLGPGRRPARYFYTTNSCLVYDLSKIVKKMASRPLQGLLWRPKPGATEFIMTWPQKSSKSSSFER